MVKIYWYMLAANMILVFTIIFTKKSTRYTLIYSPKILGK